MADQNALRKWDDEADVIIVGSGFAGLAAAIEAKAAGCSVIILEKMKGYGGNSTISDGVVAAAATQFQADLEIADTPRLMYDDMLKAGLGLNQPALVRVLTERSAETLQMKKAMESDRNLPAILLFRMVSWLTLRRAIVSSTSWPTARHAPMPFCRSESRASELRMNKESGLRGAK